MQSPPFTMDDLLRQLETILSPATNDPAALTIGEWTELAVKNNHPLCRETIRKRMNKAIADGAVVRLEQMRQDSSGRWQTRPCYKFVVKGGEKT